MQSGVLGRGFLAAIGGLESIELVGGFFDVGRHSSNILQIFQQAFQFLFFLLVCLHSRFGVVRSLVEIHTPMFGRDKFSLCHNLGEGWLAS